MDHYLRDSIVGIKPYILKLSRLNAYLFKSIHIFIIEIKLFFFKLGKI